MRVVVQYFQAAKRWSGVDSETVELSEGADISDLMGRLGEMHPPLNEARSCLMLAVNAERADTDHVLAEGDEVAVMPPFSGG